MAASADMAVAVAKNVLERFMAALLSSESWNALSAKPNTVERRPASRPWATDKELFGGRTELLIARQLLGYADLLVTDPGLEDGQARCQEAAGGRRQELAERVARARPLRSISASPLAIGIVFDIYARGESLCDSAPHHQPGNCQDTQPAGLGPSTHDGCTFHVACGTSVASERMGFGRTPTGRNACRASAVG